MHRSGFAGRVSAGILAILAAALLLVGGAGVAWAEGESISGTVRAPNGPGGLQGVDLTITGPGFEQQVTTDEAGKFSTAVPAAGAYEVALDEATLPDGISLRDPDRNPLTAQVSPGAARSVLFPTVEGDSPVSGGDGSSVTGGQVAQLALDGIVLGLILALGALGLSLIYGTTGLTNFAHGELLTIGALAALVLNQAGLPLLLAAPLAVVISGLLGGVQDRFFWRKLRVRRTGLIAMLVVSIGLGIFLRYVFLFFFGGSTEQYVDYAGQAGLQIGPLSITPKSLVGSSVAVVLLIATSLWLLRSRLGKATRAVSDNPALAAASGIDVDRVIRSVWIIGAALAAFAGILLGMNQGVRWDMGSAILLLIFAGVTVGGLGTAFGALLGGLLVGLVIQLSTIWIPPELKSVGALAILIVVLLVRPQGLLGRRERIG